LFTNFVPVVIQARLRISSRARCNESV
jgi:hypothetical protein